jgi:hypothetical protein
MELSRSLPVRARPVFNQTAAAASWVVSKSLKLHSSLVIIEDDKQRRESFQNLCAYQCLHAIVYWLTVCVFIMVLDEEEMFKVYDTELTVTVWLSEGPDEKRYLQLSSLGCNLPSGQVFLTSLPVSRAPEEESSQSKYWRRGWDVS